MKENQDLNAADIAEQELEDYIKAKAKLIKSSKIIKENKTESD